MNKQYIITATYTFRCHATDEADAMEIFDMYLFGNEIDKLSDFDKVEIRSVDNE